MADGQSYPVDKINKVKRRHDRGFYDHETVHKLLDAGVMCHVSYVIDGQPYCTPTLYWREGTRLYWLARCGFNHSADYRSVMAFGKARLVEDQVEKEHALVMMVDRFFPGRTAGLRQSTGQEIKATAVIAMDIEKASAKIRAKGVADDDEDYELPIYAERIPVHMILGAPEPCPRLLDGVTRPASLAMYADGRPLDEAALEAYAASYGEAERD